MSLRDISTLANVSIFKIYSKRTYATTVIQLLQATENSFHSNWHLNSYQSTAIIFKSCLSMKNIRQKISSATQNSVQRLITPISKLKDSVGCFCKNRVFSNGIVEHYKLSVISHCHWEYVQPFIKQKVQKLPNLLWSGPISVYLYSSWIFSFWKNWFRRALALSKVQLPWRSAFKSTSDSEV